MNHSSNIHRNALKKFQTIFTIVFILPLPHSIFLHVILTPTNLQKLTFRVIYTNFSSPSSIHLVSTDSLKHFNVENTLFNLICTPALYQLIGFSFSFNNKKTTTQSNVNRSIV